MIIRIVTIAAIIFIAFVKLLSPVEYKFSCNMISCEISEKSMLQKEDVLTDFFMINDVKHIEIHEKSVRSSPNVTWTETFYYPLIVLKNNSKITLENIIFSKDSNINLSDIGNKDIKFVKKSLFMNYLVIIVSIIGILGVLIEWIYSNNCQKKRR